MLELKNNGGIMKKEQQFDEIKYYYNDGEKLEINWESFYYDLKKSLRDNKDTCGFEKMLINKENQYSDNFYYVMSYLLIDPYAIDTVASERLQKDTFIINAAIKACQGKAI
ncbi:MAG: hypothetical protein ACI4L6_01810 [Candidatus Onthoplasma sp.]